jgi:hypothetical protein
MKNIIRTLGLAGLLALSSGCKDSREYAIDEPSVDNNGKTVLISGYTDGKQVSFYIPTNKYSEERFSTWRNYPSAGKTREYMTVTEGIFGTNAVLHKPYTPYYSGY